ncbi:MAG TPA: hypothetical protein VFB74_32565 [Kribbellaceae bacterium]|nr:hypothetical protein [Kribbellaceae bacterium]
MYPCAASAIEQVAVFVHAAERQLAVLDADPPLGWALDTADRRTDARDALRRLRVYPPQAPPMAVTDEGPVLLYELAGVAAQMIDPGTLPCGMLLTVVTTVDAATEALIDAACRPPLDSPMKSGGRVRRPTDFRTSGSLPVVRVRDMMRAGPGGP